METSVNSSAGISHGKASVLQIIYAARSILNRALSLAHPDPDSNRFPQQISELSSLLIHACELSRDVVLAAILLRQDGVYAIRHAVNVALLVELALREMGLSAVHRRPVICAALTMNVSMLALQDALMKQSGTLTQEQRESMQAHPLMGRDLLQRLGVTDPIWLECVAQHHEAPDGKGYPQHLSGKQIRFEARLISLLDHYCALLSRNARRRGQGADSALFTAISEGSSDLDAKLGHLITRTLGIYPPGTLVQLLNGEKGIVRRLELGMPVVAVLIDRNGCPSPEIIERNTGQDEFYVMAVLDLHLMGERIDMQKIWGSEAADPV